MLPLTFRHTNSLEVLKHRLEQLDTQDDNLNKQAQANIQIITIIFAFASAFKLFEASTDNMNQGLKIVIFFIYGAIVILCSYTLLPKRWLHPINTAPTAGPSDWEYYTFTVSAYKESIRKNQAVLRLKARIIWTTTVLAGVDIILIIFFASRI